jgi:DNA mismatch repair protein MutL
MSWQHAAQERVFYERLQHGQVCSHQLIPSQVVTLLAADWVCVDEHLASLSACGFTIEPFGPQVIALRTLPEFVEVRESALLFSRLIARLRGRKEDCQQALACLAAVKAGTTLVREQQEQLLVAWVQTANPHACAHNRPIYFRLSLDDVRRKIGRTGLSCEFDKEE